jgi:Tfp pilus assembly protein PilF
MNLINEIEQESDNQNCIALTLFKADIYYACGQNKKAELNYNKIVSVDSSNQKAIYKIALLLYDKENYDSSIVLLKKLIGLKSSGSFVMDINKNLDKESTEIYSEEIAFYLGLDYYYRTDLQNALNNFNYCIQHNFRLGDSYLYRGEIFAETNNSEKACRDFDSARYFGNKRVDSYIIKYCN